MIRSLLILDGALPEAGASVLTLPYGRRPLLGEIAAQTEVLPGDEPIDLVVRARGPVDGKYNEKMSAAAGRSVDVLADEEHFAAWVASRSTGERVLVLDAGRWPAGKFDLAGLVRRYDDKHGIIYFNASGPAHPGARERVEHDSKGHVTRVQRLYDVMATPDSAASHLFACILPVEVLRGTSFETLPTLRVALEGAKRTTSDANVPLAVIDLRRSEVLRAVNERILTEEFAEANSGALHVDQAEVLAGLGCSIADGARVIGPIVLHDGVTIQADATVVGPSVIGSGVTIESGAMVIQAIVGAETRVRSGITLRHCVAVNSSTAAPSADATMNAELVRPAVGDAPRGWDRSAVPRTSDRRRRVHFAIKRLMDIVISAVMLMLLLPLFAVIAVVIKLTSKGPIFFMHKRELREGREFSCVKFRTMVQGAHAMQSELLAKNEVDGPQFKIRDDPRVTRIGDWLRNTNVDELPQLFNVLVGHMSLVGPRPSPFRENQICVPWRRARLSVRPGITGLWQICRSADRSGGDFHEWIFYDIAYVRHFSIWLDLKIMAATILTRGGRWSLPLSRLIGEAKARAPFAERSVA